MGPVSFDGSVLGQAWNPLERLPLDPLDHPFGSASPDLGLGVSGLNGSRSFHGEPLPCPSTTNGPEGFEDLFTSILFLGQLQKPYTTLRAPRGGG
jgi:hypothetical protein